MILKEPSDYRIVKKGIDIQGFKDVEVINEEPVIHSADGYKKLLSRLHPRFPLPNRDVLFDLSQNLVQNKQEFVSMPYGDIVDKLSEEYHYEQKSIRDSVTSLLSANCFVEIDESKSKERLLSFVCSSIDDVMRLLREGIERNLIENLGEVKKDELELLIPKLENNQLPDFMD